MHVAGHGGPNAADYVRSNLFINLLEHTKFTTDIASALGTWWRCHVAYVKESMRLLVPSVPQLYP